MQKPDILISEKCFVKQWKEKNQKVHVILITYISNVIPCFGSDTL